MKDITIWIFSQRLYLPPLRLPAYHPLSNGPIDVPIGTVVKTPNSYYVFTTFESINLPRFAPICLFCYISNNFRRKSKLCKSHQNTANQSILGGRINMISILFVCHGSTADSQELAAFVGQNGAKCGIGNGGVLRFYYE